jgi:hypothetical protein
MEGRLRIAARVSAACALVAVVAGSWTALDPGLLLGPVAMRGSARGTALVLAVVAVPLLLASMSRAARGSAAAVVVWGGALLYCLYNALLLLFLTPFNAAFLAYVALLGTTLWSLGTLLAATGLHEVGSRFSKRAPARGVAAYAWLVGGLNVLLWLGTVLPASFGPFPASFLDGTGVATNAIYVQDLAFWLPLALVAAWWLWQRQPRGFVVVGAVLVMWVVEALSVAVDQWWGHHQDPASSVVSSGLVVPFLVLAVVGTVPVTLLLRHAGSLWVSPRSDELGSTTEQVLEGDGDGEVVGPDPVGRCPGDEVRQLTGGNPDP